MQPAAFSPQHLVLGQSLATPASTKLWEGQKFKAIFGYKASSQPTWPARDPISNGETKHTRHTNTPVCSQVKGLFMGICLSLRDRKLKYRTV